MKEGNLLNQTASAQQKKFKSWKQKTLGLWITILLVLSVTTIMQWFSLRSLQNQYSQAFKQYQSQEEKVQAVLQQHNHLQRYAHKITKKKEMPKLPISFIEGLTALLQSDEILEQCDLKNNDYQVRFLLKNANRLKPVMSQLSKSNTGYDVFIQSFEQKPQGILVEIHAKSL